MSGWTATVKSCDRISLPEKKKPLHLSAVNGRGRTSEVYVPKVIQPPPYCKHELRIVPAGGAPMCRSRSGLSTCSRNLSMASTYAPRKATSRPEPVGGDTGMACTRPRVLYSFLDISTEPIDSMDRFLFGPHAQFAALPACEAQAKSAKPEEAIKVNLKGLKHGH